MGIRNIIFRGKRVDNGEWVEGFYHCVTDNSTPKNRHYITTFKKLDNGEIVLTGQFEVIPETIGQFTGLTDDNGKKIFEGDIVKVLYSDTVGEMHKTTTVVDDIRTTSVIGWLEYADELEIIGNIHDNGELLKGEL